MQSLAYLILIAVSVLMYGAAFVVHENLSVLYERAMSRNFDIVRIEELFGARVANWKGQIDLLFVGDIMLSRSVGAMIARQSDPTYPFHEIAEQVQNADIAFGNLEGPISGRGTNRGSIYSFRADPAAVAGLRFAGFDVLSLANNHIFDWGPEALRDTVNFLSQSGIHAVGAGANREAANRSGMLTARNNNVAFLAYTTLYPKSLEAGTSSPGISSFEMEKVRETIRALRDEADVIVVSLHWGEEYRTTSTIAQQGIAQALIDAGADLVVGHHPHVMQEIERYKHGWIAYSLGNFVFDQNFSEETMRGLTLTATVARGKLTGIKTSVVQISDTFQPSIPDASNSGDL